MAVQVQVVDVGGSILHRTECTESNLCTSKAALVQNVLERLGRVWCFSHQDDVGSVCTKHLLADACRILLRQRRIRREVFVCCGTHGSGL